MASGKRKQAATGVGPGNKKLRFEASPKQSRPAASIHRLLLASALQPSQRAEQARGHSQQPPSPSTTAPQQPQEAQNEKLQLVSQAGCELWCDKYAPRGEADVVVARKKVEQLRSWLDACTQGGPVPRCLVLTGPPGCGKSSTVQVVAAAMGLEATEWTPPVPTSWQEHCYQGAASAGFTSKVSDFEAFAARAKLGALPLARRRPAQQCGQGPDSVAAAQTGAGGSPASQGGATAGHKLLVVDDLPHAAGQEQRARIAGAVVAMAASSRCPVVLMFTEDVRRSSGGGARSQAAAAQGLQKEVLAGVEALGVRTLALNPVTTAAAAKALVAVAAAEGYTLAKPDAAALAASTGGDLRAALSALQLALTGKARGEPGKAAKKSRARGKKAAAAAAQHVSLADSGALGGKDASLTMFHGMGKILHNKRGADGDGGTEPPAAAAAASSSMCACGVQRPPPASEPEAVMDASGIEAGLLLAFLHDHSPAFVDEEHIEDCATAAGYYSDAELLVNHWGQADSGGAAAVADGRSGTLTAAVGGSVAARGWMWANSHLAPRSWRPLDSPALFAVARAIAGNEEQLQGVIKRGAYVAGTSSSSSVFASALIPALRALAAAAPSHPANALLPVRWHKVWNKAVEAASEGPRTACAGDSGVGGLSEAVGGLWLAGDVSDASGDNDAIEDAD